MGSISGWSDWVDRCRVGWELSWGNLDSNGTMLYTLIGRLQTNYTFFNYDGTLNLYINGQPMQQRRGRLKNSEVLGLIHMQWRGQAAFTHAVAWNFQFTGLIDPAPVTVVTSGVRSMSIPRRPSLPPSAPRNFRAGVSGERVTLNWEPPVSLNGGSVRDYVIAGPGGNTTTTALTHSFTAPPGSNTYTCMVRTNGWDRQHDGPTVSTQVTVVQQKPATPTNVSLTFEGVKARIRFTPGVSSVPTDTYRVRLYKTLHPNPVVELNTLSTDVVLNGATVNDTYFAEVVAVNFSKGPSAPKTSSFVRLNPLPPSAPTNMTVEDVTADSAEIRNIFVANTWGLPVKGVYAEYTGPGGHETRTSDRPDMIYLDKLFTGRTTQVAVSVRTDGGVSPLSYINVTTDSHMIHPPRNLTLSYSGGRLTAQWQLPSATSAEAITGFFYEVYRVTSSGETLDHSGFTTTTSVDFAYPQSPNVHVRVRSLTPNYKSSWVSRRSITQGTTPDPGDVIWVKHNGVWSKGKLFIKRNNIWVRGYIAR